MADIPEKDDRGRFVSKNGAKKDSPEKDGAEADVESIVEETDNTAEDSEKPPGKRGRGRPPGSGKKSGGAKKSANKSDAAAFAKQIVGVHLLIAGVTGLPEMAINETEGRLLADALISVSEEYGLLLGGKTGAAIQLFAAAAMVYTPRAFAISRKMQEPPRPQHTGNIYPSEPEI